MFRRAFGIYDSMPFFEGNSTELLFFKYRSQNGFLSGFSGHPKGRPGTTG